MRRLLSLVLLGLSPASVVAQEHAHAAPHWSYAGNTGPQHWGDLESDYSTCKTGALQSPIDIRKAERSLEFEYHDVPLAIVNNGHTIQIDYAPGSFVRIDGRQYQLVQFHFHHPSEEKVEGVRWVVLQKLEEISPSQIAAFGKLFHNNARPTQASHGRAVEVSG